MRVLQGEMFFLANTVGVEDGEFFSDVFESNSFQLLAEGSGVISGALDVNFEEPAQTVNSKKLLEQSGVVGWEMVCMEMDVPALVLEPISVCAPVRGRVDSPPKIEMFFFL